MNGYDLCSNTSTDHWIEWAFGEQTLSFEVFEKMDGKWEAVPGAEAIGSTFYYLKT